MTYLHLPANDPTVHVTFLGPLSTRQALPMWKELNCFTIYIPGGVDCCSFNILSYLFR